MRSRNQRTLTIKERENISYVVSCMGYFPLERKYFIDKEINGVYFKLYSVYKSDVEKYIRGKMKRMYLGYFN